MSFSMFSLIIPKISDKVGRKWFFAGALLVASLINMTFLLLPGKDIKYFYIIIALWFISGIQSAARVPVGYIYMMEFAPEKYHSIMSTVWCTGSKAEVPS